MLVGPAAGGKSTVTAALQNALSALHESGSHEATHQRTHSVVINPKCISMGELYGEFNESTQESRSL